MRPRTGFEPQKLAPNPLGVGPRGDRCRLDRRAGCDAWGHAMLESRARAQKPARGVHERAYVDVRALVHTPGGFLRAHENPLPTPFRGLFRGLRQHCAPGRFGRDPWRAMGSPGGSRGGRGRIFGLQPIGLNSTVDRPTRCATFLKHSGLVLMHPGMHKKRRATCRPIDCRV